jgi:hypothetical protein
MFTISMVVGDIDVKTILVSSRLPPFAHATIEPSGEKEWLRKSYA